MSKDASWREEQFFKKKPDAVRRIVSLNLHKNDKVQNKKNNKNNGSGSKTLLFGVKERSTLYD